ncbi:hypothetical protein AUK40_05830 [Candidatus Wirthbacteria bacterium CG2_30_54_11]|uniref:Band 7 domain-containing protein n=1 Tax=Candidatus Wirthbacteria bacterium CG2_30_54_11 TaxID=1817892 RepID=A0A1J5IMQ6_9BACT|nr:MAG: hypothetical protein AUK40_05830 [Candidatus Wirthbacteria bacterium CG2_30_54_11]
MLLIIFLSLFAAVFLPSVARIGRGKISLKVTAGVIAFVVASIGSSFAADCYVVVQPGEVAVYSDLFRGVLDRTDGTGIHFKMPLIQKAKKFSIQTQAYTMSVATEEGTLYGDDSLQAKTSDGQDVWVDLTIFFHIDPQNAPNLWKSVGDSYVDTIIRPNTRGEVRLIISAFTAEGLYSAEKRTEAQGLMEDALSPIFSEKGITLERITLRNVNFTNEFSAAVEAKQVEYQKIQKATYELQRIEIEKQQKIVEAEGDAEAIRLRGETLKANPAVIQYEFVQKMAPNVSWGILPSGSVPFLDISTFIK